jgi:hypothetical protein
MITLDLTTNVLKGSSEACPTGEATTQPIMDPIFYSVELKRLRKMKAQKRILDEIKLAKFWQFIKSKRHRISWIRSRQHWFECKTLWEPVEDTLTRLQKSSENPQYQAQFINFEEDLAAMKALSYTADANTNALTDVA